MLTGSNIYKKFRSLLQKLSKIMNIRKIAFLSVMMMVPAVSAQEIVLGVATDARTEQSLGGEENTDAFVFEQNDRTFILFENDRVGDIVFNEIGIVQTNTGSVDVRAIDIVNAVTFSNRFTQLRSDSDVAELDVLQVYAPFERGGGRAQSAGRGVSVVRQEFLSRSGPLPQRSLGSIFRATSERGFCLSRRDNRRTIMRSQESCPGRSIIITEFSTPSRMINGRRIRRAIGSAENNNARTVGRNAERISRIR